MNKRIKIIKDIKELPNVFFNIPFMYLTQELRDIIVLNCALPKESWDIYLSDHHWLYVYDEGSKSYTKIRTY
jgi:hypothetical protein